MDKFSKSIRKTFQFFPLHCVFDPRRFAFALAAFPRISFVNLVSTWAALPLELLSNVVEMVGYEKDIPIGRASSSCDINLLLITAIEVSMAPMTSICDVMSTALGKLPAAAPARRARVQTELLLETVAELRLFPSFFSNSVNP